MLPNRHDAVTGCFAHVSRPFVYASSRFSPDTPETGDYQIMHTAGGGHQIAGSIFPFSPLHLSLRPRQRNRLFHPSLRSSKTI
jgi:hypothetical protein